MSDREASAPSTSLSLRMELATLTLGIVGVTVGGALIVGFFAGVASALLVFVTGALLGSILLVWHSLRTLAGDADVDPAFDAALSRAPTELDERKRRALRALKDIEQEHAVGKIDDTDFASLDAEYRSRAKDVIREMDAELDPYREKAEALVRSHLEKRTAARAAETAAAKKKQKKKAAAAAEAAEATESSDGDDERTVCPECETSNDSDATFCKKCGSKLTSDA
jgi:ribosomal protein L40E